MAPKRSLILQESDSTTSTHAEKELHTSSSEAANVYELKKRRTPVSSPVLSLKANDRSSPRQNELSPKKDRKNTKLSKKDKTNVAKEKKKVRTTKMHNFGVRRIGKSILTRHPRSNLGNSERHNIWIYDAVLQK